MNESASIEATTGGSKTQSRQGQYAKFEPLANTAIEKLKVLMESRNENIALGAVKTVLERTVPAIKALELTGENGEPVKFNLLTPSTYFSAVGKIAAASAESAAGRSSEVQSLNLAPESEKDNNSNQSVSSVEST